MESFFNTNIKTNLSTNNIIYNILNNDDPKFLFLYFSIIIFFIYLSSKITFNTNILIGLIFSSLIIFYLYTYKNNNLLTQTEIKKDEFNIISTKNQILNKYPKIVSFLYFLKTYQTYSISNYEKIKKLFEKFCYIYEACLLSSNNYSNYYNILIETKLKIFNSINNFNFTTDNQIFEYNLIEQKKNAQNIINDLVNKLYLLYKKNIYYNGFNINKKVIERNNIYPYNIDRELNYRPDCDKYDISNLIFY